MTSSTRKQGATNYTDHHKRHKVRRKKILAPVMTTDVHDISNHGQPCQQYNPSSGSDVYGATPGGGMGAPFPEFPYLSHVPVEAGKAYVGCNIEVIGSVNKYSKDCHGLNDMGINDKELYSAPPSMNNFFGIQPPGATCFVPNSSSMYLPFPAMTGCMSGPLNGYHSGQIYIPELANNLPPFSGTNYFQPKTSYPNDMGIFPSNAGTYPPHDNHADMPNTNVPGSYRRGNCTQRRLQKLTNTSSASENVTHSLTNSNAYETKNIIIKIRHHSTRSSEQKLRRGTTFELNSLRDKQVTAYMSKLPKRYLGKLRVIERGRISRMSPLILY